MRGKKAKELRRLVYGSDFSPRDRRYANQTICGRKRTQVVNHPLSLRAHYLKLKEAYRKHQTL